MEKIHVKLNLPVNDITSLSWEEIISKANAHKISEKCIGQEKTIMIGDTSYDVVLIDVNHDDLVDGGKANTTWQLKNCYNSNYVMNEKTYGFPYPLPTNRGGYEESDMHTTYLPSIFNQIQEDIRNAIKPVIKKTTAGNKSIDIVDVNCNLFLLSEVEIFGDSIYFSGAGEGTQYTYWSQHNNKDDRRKGTQSFPTSYEYWWERSPCADDSQSFCIVDTYGNTYSYFANSDGHNTNTVSFAFCI